MSVEPQGTPKTIMLKKIMVVDPEVALNIALEEEAAEAVERSAADVAEAEVTSGGTTMTSMCSLRSGPETS
jgi:hypothetical protein